MCCCISTGASESVQGFYDTGIGTNGFGGKAGYGTTVVVGGTEFGVLIDTAAEETTVYWAVGYEADAEFFEQGKYLFFLQPPHEVVFTLYSGQGLDGMGAAVDFGADFA